MTGSDLDPHYRRWNQDDIVDRFAGKGAADFFDSETRLLKPIAPAIQSVIDIGCASGRFVELLATLGATPRYTGLDLSIASVDRARALYPSHEFHCVNALTFEPATTADLVNATGVMQHEPRFDALLEPHDLLVPAPCPVRRQTGCHARPPGGYRPRLYRQRPADVLCGSVGPDRFLRGDRGTPRHSVGPRFFGYATPRNAKAVLPPENRAELVSAGVLLETGTPPAGGPEIISSLPPFLSNNSE